MVYGPHRYGRPGEALPAGHHVQVAERPLPPYLRLVVGRATAKVREVGEVAVDSYSSQVALPGKRRDLQIPRQEGCGARWWGHPG